MADTTDDGEPRHDALEGAAAVTASMTVTAMDLAGTTGTMGTTTEMRCCCGKEECVFLRHNCSVLLSVERDVHVAAKMGQTLLARHEAYMASAERDRLELTARIEQLEQENSELEIKNKLVTDENHSLRDELEGLNETVKDADTRIEALEATLRDSQRQVRRLEGAAERAANLERQIAMLEEEQHTLQNTLLSTREEARSAMKRWKEAQRGLIETQEQLERMEKESKEERERHVEVLSRIERQRQMEKELNTAAGRLKGAAGVKSMTDSKNGHNVVSHFVRDLLQDNANLQLGMAELREMLINSNDEIQMLREQLVYHQPVPQGEISSTSTLRAELQQKEPLSPSPPRVQHQFHIHHHYHVTHRPEQRKPKKRRQVLTAGTFSPPAQPSYASSPALSQNQWQMSRGGLGAPFSTHGQKGSSTSSISITPYGRWSMMSDNPSELAPSSAPSSPPSAHRSSMFDRNVVEMADPTSPITSIDPLSPVWGGSHRKRGSELSTQSISSAMFQLNPGQPYCTPTPSHPLAQVHDSASQLHSPYTTDDLPDVPRNVSSAHDTTIDTINADSDIKNTLLSRSLAPSGDYFDPRVEQRPRGLRRVISHESIMSLSNGMDIHTLKARPSQLTLRPLGLSAAGTNISDVTAVPTISRSSSNGRRTSVILRDNLTMAGLAAASGRGREPNRAVSSPLQARSASRQSSSSSTLGKLVAWRPWGGSSTRSDTSTTRSPLASPAVTATTSPTTIPTALLSPAVASISKSAHVSPQGSLSSAGTFRAPGINQPGMIPGFHEYWAQHKRRGAPSKVTADNLEQIQEAMREVLEDG